MSPENYFIGKTAETISTLITKQCEIILTRNGVQVPVKSCSIIVTLHRLDGLSLNEIARETDSSPQLIKQKLPKLLKLSLIKHEDDASDKRRRLFFLTDKGKLQVEKILETFQELERSLDRLNKHLGFSLPEKLEEIKRALTEVPLHSDGKHSIKQ
ncbi:hypothetical protein MJO52_09670 [Microbulbifer variabilis]|uniref:HTH marR-type domain-containing protein n=1 Tax=Microbulbifer variabilis TaxID=266805 RepID=A0ABY4VGS1_9GAMM|nr:hypothetical protein [Microbulbifer variabilis]USD23384.1 hypothetical protein MJO52_09670 [Microbulbifer variabilis]